MFEEELQVLELVLIDALEHYLGGGVHSFVDGPGDDGHFASAAPVRLVHLI
jgi:hypothetical protein